MDPKLLQLMAALGCATPEEALALVASLQTSVAALLAATGNASVSDAVASAGRSIAFARAVEAALGTTGPAALATLEGLRASHARVGELEACAQTAERATNDRDAADAMNEASADGRLPPAERPKAENMYAQFGVAGLKTFLSMLPKVGPSASPSLRQPAQAAPSANASDEDKKLAKALGVEPALIHRAAQSWDEARGEISTMHTQTLNAKQPARA